MLRPSSSWLNLVEGEVHKDFEVLHNRQTCNFLLLPPETNPETLKEVAHSSQNVRTEVIRHTECKNQQGHSLGNRSFITFVATLHNL